MTLTLASTGAQSRLYIEPGAAAHTFDSSSETYEFIRESLAKRGTIVDTNGIRGTRSHHEMKTRFGTYEVGGEIVMNPDPAMLDLWLPRILGANESTDTFALAETLQPFGVLIDRVGGTFEYTDCYVNKATFRGQQGQMVELTLEIWGATEATGTSAPSVSIAIASNTAPYIFSDLALTLQSASRTCLDFELVIDNMLERRFANSVTATSITPQDRMVTLRTTTPFTSTEMSALYGQSLLGAAGTLVLTNGAMSTTFTFGKLQVPSISPSVGGKTEVSLRLEMVARMTSTTRELVVTHDSTA
jgi:hypothetical protein